MLEMLAGYPPIVAIILFTAVLMLIISLIYKKMVDQAVVAESKSEMKDLQEQMKKAQKDGDTEKANALMSEVFKHNTHLMKQMFKPMIVSMVFFVLLVPFLSAEFAEGGIYEGQEVLVVPMFGDIGWFWTYLIFAIAFSVGWRRVLGVKI